MSDWNGKNSGLVPDRMKQAAQIVAEAIIYFSQANGGESDDCGVYFSELCKYIGGDAGFFERFIAVFSEATGTAVPNGVPHLDSAGKIAALFGQVMSIAGKAPDAAGNVPLYGADLQLSETDVRNVAALLSALNLDKADTYKTDVLDDKPLVYAGAGDFCALIRFGEDVPAANASLQFDRSVGGLVFTPPGNVSYTDPGGNHYPIAINGAWAVNNARWDISTRTFSLAAQGTITAKSGDLPIDGYLLWYTGIAVDPRYNFEKAQELKARLTAIKKRAESNTDRITQAEADLEKETENRVQSDAILDEKIEKISDDLAAHTGAFANPHQVSLSQAAAQQQTEDTVLQGNLFKCSVTEGNKLVTRSEVTAMGIDSMHYKGQLKYGALTLADRGTISGMAAGDICGVQTTQTFYQWDGASWQVQPHGEDKTGDVWDILSWYGVWNSIVYMGDVTATIKCRDGINHLWDLIVNADFMRDGEITDNAIGNRTLLDNAGDGNLIATTAKKLTAWLQGLRNNVKWLFTHLNAHIADTVIHITAAEKTEWFAKYNKPAAGIPKTDLDVNVQASLDKADASATAHALDEETTRAIEAETSLQASIDDEAAARETADTALQADIDAEAAARETADTAEATTRSQADTTLQTNITAEATARQAADTAEATARSQADTTLQTNLNTETARAQDAEDTLQDNLDAEATARENADTALQAGIDAAADAADAAQATADAAKAIAESAIHLKGVLMFGADTVASMQSIPTARLNDGDACGVHETNLSYKWNAADQAWGELAHGADEVGDQWNINSWYGVWQNQTFTGNATATIICIRTEPLYWALSVSESTPVGGDLGIDGAHIDILQQTAPSPITESLLKFGGGFAAKFSGFFQAVVAKINGIFSLLDLEEGKRESADAVLQANIDAEEARAKTAEDAKVDKEAGKGLSSNDFTDSYAQLIHTLAGDLKVFHDGIAHQSDVYEDILVTRYMLKSDLSATDSAMSVTFDGLIFQARATSPTNLRTEIAAETGTVLATIRRNSFYNTNVEGQTAQQVNYTTTFQTIDSTIYVESNDYSIYQVFVNDHWWEINLWAANSKSIVLLSIERRL